MILGRDTASAWARRLHRAWTRLILRPIWPTLIAGAIGVALSSAGAFLVARYWEDVQAQAELNVLGDNRYLLLRHDLTDLERTIKTIARHLATSSGEPDKDEFDRLADIFGKTHGGRLDFDWAPRLPAHESDLPAAASASGEHFPILFSSDPAKGPARLGTDILSDPVQRAALRRAQLTGYLAATPVAGGTTEIFLFAPVYRDGEAGDTEEDRRHNLLGVVRAAVPVGPLIDQVFRAVAQPRGLDIHFFRQGADPSEFPFHVRSSLLRATPAVARPRQEIEAALHATRDIVFGDQRWTMIVAPILGKSSLVDRENSLMAFGVGLLVTLASVIYVELSRRHLTRLGMITADLHESEEKFRRLTENAQDAIIMTDSDGLVRFWNPAAERIFGYRPDEILGRSAHETLTPQRYRSKAFAGYARFARTGTGDVLNKTLELDALRKDGTEFPVELSVSSVKVGPAWHAIALARDITERKRLTEASDYRSKLLQLASTSAKELLTAPAIQDAMARVLEMIGQAMHVDRVLVLEIRRNSSGAPVSALRYSWQSASAPAMPALHKMVPSVFESDPWFAPLHDGKAVTCVPGTMKAGPLKNLFQRLGIVSSLDVPVVIEGRYWGRICFDDCTKERQWTPIDVDILRIVADMIGSAIIRERYVEQLKDANTIIERSPTILYRMRGEPSLPLTYVSHNITLFGYDPAEMIASPELYKTYIHPDDESKVQESMAQAAMEGSRPAAIEFRLRKSDGTYRWVESRHMPIRDSAGRLIEVEGTLTDITERKEAAEKIVLLARTDALTGLANRATFIDRLRQTFAAARRGARPFAVLYLDLDRFKDINDTLGHYAGDLLLKGVAERLKASTRESDLVARLGGDEFAILQTELPDLASAGTLASKVHDILGAPYRLGETEVHISASIGISPYTPEALGPDEMLSQADLALYRAKEEGRDQYCFHSADLDHEVRERVALTNDLRKALERDELELHYQPQVELATGRIVGMEALIRWNHPKRGLLKPGAFLPIVDKSGVIVTLGQWVLDHACAQMSTWRDVGLAPPTIAVNVSLAQLRAGEEFVATVTETLARWGLSPKDLELDVTESMLAYVTLHKNNVLDRLQQLGIKIAIDDFGTQYSSLDYLKTYRVSRLKIPRPMITAATQDPGESAMVRAIIGVARELDIEVVAQGVETEAQRALLSCAPSTTKVQGYYYSAPVCASDATDLLRQRLLEPRLTKAHSQESMNAVLEQKEG